MADWRVFREQVSVFPHPNAERLDVCKVGEYPLVCQKGLYNDGDIVIFIPEKSILPPDIAANFVDYLRGSDKNRVGSITLRGEPSLGIVIPDREEFKDIPFGEDISEKLNISQYIPPIPTQLQGNVRPMPVFCQYRQHDVEQFTINKKNFIEGEEVVFTEKLHGSQCICLRDDTGERLVSSKGMIKRNLTLENTEANSYWRGARQTKIFDLLDKYYPTGTAQIFGELLPVQKGFDYGQKEPTIRFFRLLVNGNAVGIDDVPEEIKALWVPILYRGPYDLDILMKLKEGKEQLSGTQRHIKEGGVLAPIVERKDVKGHFTLLVKLLNSKYKNDDDEVN